MKNTTHKKYRRPSKEEQLEMQRKALSADPNIAAEGKNMIVSQYDRLITYAIKKQLLKSQKTVDFEQIDYIRLAVYISLFEKGLKAWDPDKDLRDVEKINHPKIVNDI